MRWSSEAADISCSCWCGGRVAACGARTATGNARRGLPQQRFARTARADGRRIPTGLSEVGYVEGRNLAIEFRWADNQYDRLPALTNDLVRRQVAVIAATGGPATGLAIKAATSTILFVFITGVDPVRLGLVASLNRPGGNATGVNVFITAVEAKRLGLLHELVPTAAEIAVIVNPNSPELDAQLSDLHTAAQTIGRRLHILRAGNARGTDR
jgi:putative tryptophan/tyrosine transport system substrate-binding protein